MIVPGLVCCDWISKKVNLSHENSIVFSFFILAGAVFVSGQALSLWLGRYQSPRSRRLVTGIGAFLSTLFLVLIVYSILIGNSRFSFCIGKGTGGISAGISRQKEKIYRPVDNNCE